MGWGISLGAALVVVVVGDMVLDAWVGWESEDLVGVSLCWKMGVGDERWE